MSVPEGERNLSGVSSSGLPCLCPLRPQDRPQPIFGVTWRGARTHGLLPELRIANRRDRLRGQRWEDWRGDCGFDREAGFAPRAPLVWIWLRCIDYQAYVARSGESGVGSLPHDRSRTGQAAMRPPVFQCGRCGARTAQGDFRTEGIHCFHCWPEKAQGKPRTAGLARAARRPAGRA